MMESASRRTDEIPTRSQGQGARSAARGRCPLVEDNWIQRHRGGWPRGRRGRDVRRVLFELPEQRSDARGRHRRRGGPTVPVGYGFGNPRGGEGTADQFSRGLHQRPSQRRPRGGLRNARLERRRLTRATPGKRRLRPEDDRAHRADRRRARRRCVRSEPTGVEHRRLDGRIDRDLARHPRTKRIPTRAN